MNNNTTVHFLFNTEPFTSVIVWDITVSLTKVVFISNIGNVIIIYYFESVLLILSISDHGQSSQNHSC